MPTSRLSDQEIEQLLAGIVREDCAGQVAELLDDCHEFKTYGSLQPYEKYFRKDLMYRSFKVHIPYFVAEGGDVFAADVQLKRPSKFPAPYVNRNLPLMKKLRKILYELYVDERIHAAKNEHGKQFHYKSSKWRPPTVPFEEWGSECALYDEPHSSRQTAEDLTAIRNDFVIIRFRRREA